MDDEFEKKTKKERGYLATILFGIVGIVLVYFYIFPMIKKAYDVVASALWRI